MPRSDYLPFAFGDGANIVSQPDWNSDPDREFGFGQGKAMSAKFNKAWRQASTVSAGIGLFITEYSDIDVVDDGDHVRFKEMFHQAIYDAIGGQPLTGVIAGVGLESTLGDLGHVTVSLIVPVAAIYGGTGLTSYQPGDLLYADTTTTLVRLPLNSNGYRYLTNGGVDNTLTWSLFDLSANLSGILPIFYGGTGGTTGHSALDNLSGAVGEMTGSLYRQDDGTWSVETTGTVSAVIAGLGLDGGGTAGEPTIGETTLSLEIPVTIDHGGTGVTSIPVYSGGSLGIPYTLLMTIGDKIRPISSGQGSLGTLGGPTLLISACSGTFPEFVGFRANGPVDAPTALGNDDYIGILSFRGYTGGGWSNNNVRIMAQTTEAWTASAQGSKLAFYTTEKGTTNFQPRMTVRNGIVIAAPSGGDQGDMGVGTLNMPTIPYVNGASIFLNTALSGIPTAPTAGTGNATSQIASTAFVMAAVAAGGGGVGGGISVAVGDTAPVSPTVGQLWWDSVSATMFMWYTDPTSSQWVPTTSQPGPPGAAGAVGPAGPAGGSPDRVVTTKTANYTVQASDLGTTLVLGGVTLVLTLPAGIFTPGKTLGVSVTASLYWSVTNSTGLTMVGLNSTSILTGTSGTFVANADGTTLNFIPGMQPPTTASIGGVKYLAATTNNFVTGLDSLGNLLVARPSFANLSGTATIAQGGTGATTAAAALTALGALPIAGGTMTNGLTIAPAAAWSLLVLNKPAGSFGSQIVGQRAGLTRWDITAGTGTAETGNNAGSDFSISRYSDAGTLISSPLNISRATGTIIAAGTLQQGIANTVNSEAGFQGISSIRPTYNEIACYGGGASGPYIAMASDNTTGWLYTSLGVNMPLIIQTNGYFAVDTGGGLGEPVRALTIATDRSATFAGAINANANLAINASANVNNNGIIRWWGPGGTNLSIFDDGNSHIESTTLLWVNGNGRPVTIGGTVMIYPPAADPVPVELELRSPGQTFNVELQYHVPAVRIWKSGVNTSGDYYVFDANGTSTRMVLSSNGTNYCSNGSWVALSDQRLKRDVTDYPHGLSEICSLRPVSFAYQGSPYNKDGDQQFGLIAQDVEPHLPELVGEYYYDPAAQSSEVDLETGEPLPQRKGMITEPMMLKTLDNSRLVFALINSVRELAAQVEELRSAISGSTR